MLELFPEGFEEVVHDDGVELVAYTDPGGEERLLLEFGSAVAEDVTADWDERWKRFHRPVRVGNLWIGPPWEEIPSGAIAVVVDPGRAFGTGAHPTTRLALELLSMLRRGSVLDVGCGSGVLAIAAAKLGFEPVLAIDVDDNAVAATRANAALNRVHLDVRKADAAVTDLPPTDVVVANVTHEVAGLVLSRARSRYAVTSGYLLDESVHGAGYRHADRIADGGWAADLYERIAE